jgi:hypothetical protein
MIEAERRLELGPLVNSSSLKPLSLSSGLRYVAIVAPDVVRNPDKQNKRRLEAKNDVYNQILLAAVATAILDSPFFYKDLRIYTVQMPCQCYYLIGYTEW